MRKPDPTMEQWAAALDAERRRLIGKAKRKGLLPTKPPVMADALAERALALAAEGVWLNEAARRLGVGSRTLTSWARRKGVVFGAGPKGRRNHWGPEVVVAIRACAERGLTLTETAREHGMNVDSLRHWAKRNKVAFRKPDFAAAKRAWWDAHPEAKPRVMAEARAARQAPLTPEERRALERIRRKAPGLARAEVLRAVGRSDLLLPQNTPGASSAPQGVRPPRAAPCRAAATKNLSAGAGTE